MYILGRSKYAVNFSTVGFLLICFMCVCLSVCMCTPHVQVPKKPGESLDSLETGLMDGCELRCQKPNPSVLRAQPGLLPTKHSLQPVCSGLRAHFISLNKRKTHTVLCMTSRNLGCFLKQWSTGIFPAQFVFGVSCFGVGF